MQKLPVGSVGAQPVAGVPAVVNENSAQTPKGSDAAFTGDVAPNTRIAITNAIEPVSFKEYLIQSLRFSAVTVDSTIPGIIARTGSLTALTQLTLRLEWWQQMYPIWL